MAKSSTFKYEINLRPPRGLNLKELYSDILYGVFIRTPPSKMASFSIIRANLPMVIIEQIQNDVADNAFSLNHHWYMDIWQINETEEAKKDRKFKLMFRKPYVILACKIYDSADMSTSQRRHVQLVMVNPVIHELSTTNDYNKVLQDTTALNAIKDYENILKEQHGEMFTFNRIGSKLNPNDFKYEQIFVPSSVDSLHVPEYLIHTYKPYNSFSYYFFDDFHFQTDATKNVTCHHINIFEKAVFKKFDITRFADATTLTHEIGRFNLNDVGLQVDKNFKDATPAFRGREIKADDFKRTKSKVLKHTTSSNTTDDLTEDRSISTVQKTDISKKTVQRSSQHFSTYTPDDIDVGEQRLIKIKETLKQKIDRIFYFEAKNALIDFPSFGLVYNMELDNKTSYSYTPLAITNIFTRMGEKDEVLVHNPRFSMIRFTDPADVSVETKEDESKLTFTSDFAIQQLKTTKKKIFKVLTKQLKKPKIDIPGVLTTNKPQFITTLNDIINMPESVVASYREALDKAKNIFELWEMFTQLPVESFNNASAIVVDEFTTVINEWNRRQAIIKKVTEDVTNIRNVDFIKDVSELTNIRNIFKFRGRR